ncbi:MAG TPA: hypothetical protein VMU26_25235 [Candidatus Polarisedimenticolia bacterium]|nr:hypothetical protein [Candidatus Polarisedimenticolia bacterium]
MKDDHAQRTLESLDNPIWFALTTDHRLLAGSHGLARRHPPDVSPLAALLHPTNDVFADLQRLVSPGEHVALFTASSPDVPSNWQVDRSRWIDQMICVASLVSPPVAPLPLGATDVPEVLELIAVTEPGPVPAANNPDGKLFRDTRERWEVGRNGRRAITSRRIRGNQRSVHSSRISRPRICAGSDDVSRSSDSGGGKDSLSSRQV